MLRSCFVCFERDSEGARWVVRVRITKLCVWLVGWWGWCVATAVFFLLLFLEVSGSVGLCCVYVCVVRQRAHTRRKKEKKEVQDVVC